MEKEYRFLRDWNWTEDASTFAKVIRAFKKDELLIKNEYSLYRHYDSDGTANDFFQIDPDTVKFLVFERIVEVNDR